MLDSVLVARDKFLKPGGALYPSHARMFLAPIRSNQWCVGMETAACRRACVQADGCPCVRVRVPACAVVLPVGRPTLPFTTSSHPACSRQRHHDFQNSMEGWAEFCEDMKQYYGVTLECLSGGWAGGRAGGRGGGRGPQPWYQRPASPVRGAAVLLARLPAPRFSASCPSLPTVFLARPARLPRPPSEDYRKEQMDYFSYTAAWTDVHPSQVVGSAACFKSYDLATVTLEELKAPLKVCARGTPHHHCLCASL